MRADKSFIPAVTSFAENMAIALGLGKSEALRLTLATEEVFHHFCRIVFPQERWVEIQCSGGGYYVRMDFILPTADFDLRVFNITASISLSDETQIEELGLFLASRSVDRFRMQPEEGLGFKLTFVKEKVYPPIDDKASVEVRPLDHFTIETPDSGELKRFTELVNTYYEEPMIPDFFKYPGKLVDMVQSKDYRAAVAMGPKGEIGGGILWRGASDRAVECFGPYLFNQKTNDTMASALIDGCIAAIARTSAVVLISRFPPSDFPQNDFEYLGYVTHFAEDGTGTRRDAWARLLCEDEGSTIWAHPELVDFLRKEYDRLILPREIRPSMDHGEHYPPHSVLMSDFDRRQGSVTLRSVWRGNDFAVNLRQHLELFHKEGIRNIFFLLDLSESNDAGFTPALLKHGFKPCLVLPYAGTGDMILFQADGMSL